MTTDLRDILANTPLFEGLDNDELDRIIRIGVVSDVAAGDSVISEGKFNPALFIILKGKFDVLLPATMDRFSKINLAQRKVGDALGEYSFADGLPAVADVRAIEKATVFVLKHETFHALLDSDSGLGARVYKNLLLQLVRRLREETSELDLFRP